MSGIKPLFNGHKLTTAEKKSRALARQQVVDGGYLCKKGDPREVHHIDQNSMNNAWDNLLVVNKCKHHMLHGAKACPSTGACEDAFEQRFPSFAFTADGTPYPFEQWNSKNSK